MEEERLAAVGETAAGLAHWLKNTLNGLRAGQYVIDRAVERNDGEKLGMGWAAMKKSLGRVEKLTSDLLYCARERLPEMVITDVNAVIRDVVDMMEARSAGKGVRLETDLDIADSRASRCGTRPTLARKCGITKRTMPRSGWSSNRGRLLSALNTPRGVDGPRRLCLCWRAS